MRFYRSAIFTLLLGGWILSLQPSALGADSRQLLEALDQISHPKVDPTTTLDLNGYILRHKDLHIRFQSGQIAFFAPLILDGDTLVFGAYFEGTGLFQFAPGTTIEQQQLFRFFHTDSLNRRFSSLVMFFGSDLRDSIVAAGKRSANPLGPEAIGKAADAVAKIGADIGERSFLETLRNLSTPIGGPFLVVDLEPALTDRLRYAFDPYSREEVQLYKEAPSDTGGRMQLVSSYSQYLDSTYRSIDGLSKEQIEVTHYAIDASVDQKGMFRGRADVTFNVARGPFQLLPMTLGSRMHLDSIDNERGNQIRFRRTSSESAREDACELFFDSPLKFGDTLTLSFYYHGRITDSLVSDFFVSARTDWYPKYFGYRQRALFDITFHTPSRYALVVSGNRIDQSSAGDTLVTTWKVLPPVEDVSFSIGDFHTFTTDAEGAPRVTLYFSQRLHEAIATSLKTKQPIPDSSMQQQAGADLVNSIRLFSQYFGPYPYPGLIGDEIPVASEVSSPGLTHLSFDTWKDFEDYPEGRLARFAQVARQWWGVGVGYDTYHDQWLCDGLTAYSALLYLQAAEGNDQFLDRLRGYKNDVFTSRKYVSGSGQESGPISLGFRTSGANTPNSSDRLVLEKGALVLHMLRNLLIDFKTMKEDAFFGMVSEFYQSNRGRNVSTAEFQRLTEKYTGIGMDWFFRQFVYGTELPTYDFSYDYEPDSSGSFIAHGHILTHGVGAGFQMYVPLEIQIDDANRAYVRLLVDSSDYSFTLPALPKEPKKLILNPFESVLAKVNQAP